MANFIRFGIFLLAMPVFASTEYDKLLETLDSRQIWESPRGEMSIQVLPELLDLFDVEVFHHGRKVSKTENLPIRVEPLGTLSFLAPFGNFERFHQGRLEVITGLEFRYRGRSLDLNRASLVPNPFHGQPGLALVDRSGRMMLQLTHFHVLAVPEENRLEIKNADVYPTVEFDKALGFPDHSALMIGKASFDLYVSIPQDADTSQQAPRCTGRAWPQDGLPADVALISIGSVQQMGLATTPEGGIKVTPSATLKNVGVADIPWVPKFNQIPQYIHQPRDQHPYLLWAMYRIHEGRIEMLGNSGVKHAWFTVNTACACAGGNILWSGCEDVYGTSINDAGSDLGPREDVVSHLGLFESCGSFFDPGCIGGQTQGSGSGFLNRMVVHPDQLEASEAQYFFDSWYVVQYDVNIWNTMGYRSITPTQVGSGWSFGPLGPFTQGPPLNQWVPENNTDPMADHKIIVAPPATAEVPYPGNMPQGHLRVLVKVEERPEGDYLYRYAVMNFDLDRGINAFRIPAAGVDLSEIWMGGPPDVLDAPWSNSVDNGKLVFAAPEGSILPWFTLYNFEFVAPSPPVESTLELNMAGSGADRTALTFQTLGPDDGGSFTLQAQPDSMAVCGDDAAEFTISVLPVGKFADPVTLVINSILPAGMNSEFSVNPVSPGGDSLLSLTTAGVDGGNYEITVAGSDGGDLSDQVTVMLALSEAQPDQPGLVSPQADALAVSPGTSFEWSPDALAVQYRLQVATENDFDASLIDALVEDNSHLPETPLAAWTEYQWRVRTENHCGEGDYSPTWGFTTGVSGDNPAPTLASIDPNEAIEGDAALTLVLSGAQFHPAAEVYWGDQALVRDWQSVTTMTAEVPADLLELNAQVPITVVNPAPGGGASNTIVFHVQPSVIFEDRYEQEAAAE